MNKEHEFLLKQFKHVAYYVPPEVLLDFGFQRIILEIHLLILAIDMSVFHKTYTPCSNL